MYVNNILFINFDDKYLKSLKKRFFKRFKMFNLRIIFHYLKILITRLNNRNMLN